MLKLYSLHNIHILFTFVIAFTCVISPLSSQEYAFDLQKFTIKDGLPNTAVFNIEKDNKGYIWFSYQGGISRFDGIKFKNYNAALLKISDIGGVEFAIDKNNRIWYTEGYYKSEPRFSGIIDPISDTVYSFDSLTQNLIESEDVCAINTIDDGSKDFLICTRDGLMYRYYYETEKIEKIFQIETTTDDIFHGTSYKKDIYWIAHGDEIFKLNNQTGKIEYKNFPIGRMSFDHFRKKKEEIIAEYHVDYPISSFRLEQDNFDSASSSQQVTENITSDIFYTDEFRCFSIEEKLIIEDYEGRRLFEYSTTETDGSKIPFLCKNAFQENDNVYWLGSNKGLIRIKFDKIPFQIIKKGKSMRAIFEDENKLFVSGYDTPNTVYDLQTGKESFLNIIKGEMFSNSISKDKNGIYWMAGGGSLLRYDSNTNIGEFKVFRKDSKPLVPNIAFINPVTDHLLIGTDRAGIIDWNKKTSEERLIYRRPPPFPTTIRHFFQNDTGIWVATGKGLVLLDSQSEDVIAHYDSDNTEMPNDNILYIEEDKEGIFWLGTKEEGLIRWDREKNEFRQFTREEGLSNNTIYAVLEDDFGKLWLSSNYGLMCFDKENFETIVFSTDNGIPSQEFNTYSHLKGKDGTLYFGGLNGIVKFHPKDLEINQQSDIPLYISKVRILANDGLGFTEKTAVLKKEKEITLRPDDRILHIEAALLDYTRPADNRYAYKIEGFQDNWVYAFDNRIQVTKPGYGDYVLKIKGRSAAGAWSDNVQTIPIHVTKPFYLQNWFLICSTLFLLGLFYYIYTLRVNNLKKRQVYLEDEVKKRTEIIEKDKQIILEQSEYLKETDAAKTRFFSNIAHEIRTPLTLITGPLQKIIEKYPKETAIRKSLTNVAANGDRLLQLVNQLLDISKLENGDLKLDYSFGDIARFTYELTNRFLPIAEEKGVLLKNINSDRTWKVQLDSDKWSKILYNLLSNAIKFTKSGGKVEILLSSSEKEAGKFISLTVKDSGIGITEEQKRRIYNRFYQVDNSSTRAYDGSGIGLSLVKDLVELQGGEITVSSKAGEGTEFIILLPLIEQPQEVETENIEEASLLETSDLLIESKEKASSPSYSLNEQTEQLTILIVEDNTEMRNFIKSCIEDKKFEIIEAVDGEDGLKMAIDRQPDLIISDIMMPKKDGYQLTQELRQDIITSHIPIILLTAKVGDESRLQGLTVGADAFLTKPFNTRELEVRIDNFLHLRQSIQHHHSHPEQFLTEEKHSIEEGFIIEIRNFVLENIESKNLNGDIIGRHIGMSRTQLHRKLKAVSGQSISEIVKNIRLNKAMQLLLEKRLNISEISHKTGFSSVAYFSKSFKQAFGKNPSEVQKQ